MKRHKFYTLGRSRYIYNSPCFFGGDDGRDLGTSKTPIFCHPFFFWTLKVSPSKSVVISSMNCFGPWKDFLGTNIDIPFWKSTIWITFFLKGDAFKIREPQICFNKRTCINLLGALWFGIRQSFQPPGLTPGILEFEEMWEDPALQAGWGVSKEELQRMAKNGWL